MKGSDTAGPDGYKGEHGYKKDAMSVHDLSVELVNPAWHDRGCDRAIVQYIMDWNSRPIHKRLEMLKGTPHPDVGLLNHAKVASVIHGLCQRDGLELPKWAEECKAEEPYALFNCSLAGHYGNMIKSTAPSVCEIHNVWYPADMLEDSY